MNIARVLSALGVLAALCPGVANAAPDCTDPASLSDDEKLWCQVGEMGQLLQEQDERVKELEAEALETVHVMGRLLDRTKRVEREMRYRDARTRTLVANTLRELDEHIDEFEQVKGNLEAMQQWQINASGLIDAHTSRLNELEAQVETNTSDIAQLKWQMCRPTIGLSSGILLGKNPDFTIGGMAGLRCGWDHDWFGVAGMTLATTQEGHLLWGVETEISHRWQLKPNAGVTLGGVFNFVRDEGMLDELNPEDMAWVIGPRVGGVFARTRKKDDAQSIIKHRVFVDLQGGLGLWQDDDGVPFLGGVFSANIGYGVFF